MVAVIVCLCFIISDHLIIIIIYVGHNYAICIPIISLYSIVPLYAIGKHMFRTVVVYCILSIPILTWQQ